MGRSPACGRPRTRMLEKALSSRPLTCRSPAGSVVRYSWSPDTTRFVCCFRGSLLRRGAGVQGSALVRVLVRWSLKVELQKPLRCRLACGPRSRRVNEPRRMSSPRIEPRASGCELIRGERAAALHATRGRPAARNEQGFANHGHSVPKRGSAQPGKSLMVEDASDRTATQA